MRILPHDCKLVLKGKSDDGREVQISHPVKEMVIKARDWGMYSTLANRNTTFGLVKKEELRVWTPDGIGDLHWVFLKLGALKKACGAKKLILYKHKVSKDKDYFVRTHRAKDFVEMNPVVDELVEVEEHVPVLEEGFVLSEEPYDYAIDPTLFLNIHESIEDWLPDLAIDWNYLQSWDVITASIGHYNITPIVYFGDRYAELTWAGSWSDGDWAEIVNEIFKIFGIPPCVLGLTSDSAKAKGVEAMGGTFVDLIGQTNLEQCIWKLRKAPLVVGSISGLTILSAAIGVPTIAFWPDEKSLQPLPAVMRTNWLPKDQVNRTYFPLPYSTHVDKVKEVIKTCLKIS